jgi:hypothetical protein
MILFMCTKPTRKLERVRESVIATNVRFSCHFLRCTLFNELCFTNIFLNFFHVLMIFFIKYNTLNYLIKYILNEIIMKKYVTI